VDEGAVVGEPSLPPCGDPSVVLEPGEKLLGFPATLISPERCLVLSFCLAVRVVRGDEFGSALLH